MSSDMTPTRRAIDRRMAELGIETYGELAAAADMQPATLSRILNEKAQPQVRSRIALGDVLGWQPDWPDHMHNGSDPEPIGDALTGLDIDGVDDLDPADRRELLQMLREFVDDHR